MSDLFSIYGILKLIQETKNGFEGISSLYGGLNLHHYVHDVSIPTLSESVLLEELRGECVA